MRRLVTTSLIAVLVLFCICAALGRPATAAAASSTQAASQRTTTDMNSPTTLDPDDDDVATELTYHWQDKFYSRDERIQMGYILIFLCAVAAATGMRKTLRSRRYAAHIAKGPSKT